VSVLVTGATGFIGSHFLKNESRINLRILTNDLRSVKSCNEGPALQMSLADSDVVLHLAGLAHKKFSDEALDDINHLATLHLARASAEENVKRFVFVSTVNVHGRSTSGIPFVETSKIDSSSAQSKIKAENGLIKIGKETGMEVTIIRPVLVYGLGAPGNMGLLIKIATNVFFTPFALVNNKRSFISIGNLCDFLYTCCVHPKAANEVFLISDGKSISTPEIISAISLGMSKKILQLPIPVFALRALGKIIGRAGQVDQLIGDLEVDCSKATELLGWKHPETMAQAMDKFK
jgi:nucleoside-diphosphate-sugar epimerase